METNDIKNIWKTGVKENLSTYYEEKLNEMVVKSARKSIKALYPRVIFRLVIITVIVFLIGSLFFETQNREKMLIDFCALIVTSVSYFVWELSFYKMRKYTYGMPVKEWLEYRIKEVESSIKFVTKYNLVMYACSLLFSLGFYAFYQIATKIPPNLINIIVIPTGLIIFLLIAMLYQTRNYKKALDELKELYKQFEESNE